MEETLTNVSSFFQNQKFHFYFPALIKETELEFFEIHFDTSTYDKVEWDIKVTNKAVLDLA